MGRDAVRPLSTEVCVERLACPCRERSCVYVQVGVLADLITYIAAPKHPQVPLDNLLPQ